MAYESANWYMYEQKLPHLPVMLDSAPVSTNLGYQNKQELPIGLIMTDVRLTLTAKKNTI